MTKRPDVNGFERGGQPLEGAWGEVLELLYLDFRYARLKERAAQLIEQNSAVFWVD